jgi:hypothetical protein
MGNAQNKPTHPVGMKALAAKGRKQEPAASSGQEALESPTLAAAGRTLEDRLAACTRSLYNFHDRIMDEEVRHGNVDDFVQAMDKLLVEVQAYEFPKGGTSMRTNHRRKRQYLDCAPAHE